MAALRSIYLYSPNKSAVFFNEELPLDGIGPVTRAQNRIGAIWTRLRYASDMADKISLMEKLGVCETDRDAHRDLLPLLRIIFTRDIEIAPSEDDSGVYFLSCNGDKFAVFKIGEKRARTELLARKIAHRVGLEKQVIPGIACTIQYPEFLKDAPVRVDLFNGNVAVFSNSDNPDVSEDDYDSEVQSQNDHMGTPYTVTGILEPYIKEKHPVSSVEDFASLITFALLIGLRDGKLDGMLNGQLIDLEDIMPARVIPEREFDANVAATHLPLLAHKLAKTPIPIAALLRLSLLISEDSFSLSKLAEELAREMVGFGDLAAESLTLKNKTPEDLGHVGWSDGGCPIRVESAVKIMDQYPLVEVNAQNARFLTDHQIRAFRYRVLRLRSALELCSKIGGASSLDLVFAVDPLYAAHWDAFKDCRLSPEQMVGRMTPKSQQARLSPELVERVKKAREEEMGALTLGRARSCPQPKVLS